MEEDQKKKMSERDFMAKVLMQMVEDSRKRDEQMATFQKLIGGQLEQMMELVRAVLAGGAAATTPTTLTEALPNFSQFDSASELWTDYWCRFKKFFEAHSVPEEMQPHVFLKNQSPLVYKMIATLSAQQSPPKDTHRLTMEEIAELMADQFNPQRFVVRERFRFWSQMNRKPGETIPELGARFRGAAKSCEFASIKDPQDEAMLMRFICSVDNEAVRDALFRLNDDELTFAKAVEIAQRLEDAAAVDKGTVYGSPKSKPAFQGEPANGEKVGRRETSPPAMGRTETSPSARGDTVGRRQPSPPSSTRDVTCYNCQRKGHVASKCRARQGGSPPQQQPISDQHGVRVIRSARGTGEVPGGAFVHRTSHHTLRRRVGVAGRTNIFSTTAELGFGGASQERRPDGAVGDWKKDHQSQQPQKGSDHRQSQQPQKGSDYSQSQQPQKGSDYRQSQQPQKGSDYRQPLSSDDRPTEQQTSTAKTDNPVATKQRALTPAAVDEETSETSRVARGVTPAASDERQELSEEGSSVAHGSSTSVRERESRRLEAKRRKKGRNRKRRRERQSLQKTTDRDFVGEESGEEQKSIARRPPTTESADIGSRSVTRDDGVGAAVSSTLALEPAELRCQSPGTMQERRQIGRGTDRDGSTKGKFAFSSIHCAVRQPSDGFSSVFAFRVARRDDAEQQPSDGVADEDPGRTMTCDKSAPPQTEEVPSPSHVSPQGNERELVSDEMPDSPSPLRSRQHSARTDDGSS